MGWSNRGIPFITAQGEAQRQSNASKTRIRLQIYGIDQAIWVRADSLFDMAEFLDDLCDAVEDGEFEVEAGAHVR